MKSISVKGTYGYEDSIDEFVKASLALDFDYINEAFLPFLPKPLSNVLDLGAGVGQNANAFAHKGYRVVAVEPLKTFLDIAKAEYASSDITWLQDALPEVPNLLPYKNAFQFILLDGVWHHLHPNERNNAMARIKALLHETGCCAVSLRHGPAGVGKHVFPTSTQEMVKLSEKAGLMCQIISQNQASKLKNKENVTWSRVVLKHR